MEGKEFLQCSFLLFKKNPNKDSYNFNSQLIESIKKEHIVIKILKKSVSIVTLKSPMTRTENARM